MKNTLVITDVTQMPQEFSNGNEACVVGVDKDGKTIRPVCKGGFQKDYLVQNNNVIIRPGAKVEFDLQVITVIPPHVEDMDFKPSSIVSKGFCTDVEWEKTLQQTSFSTVDDIYEGKLQGNECLPAGTNTRSIATLSGAKIVGIQLAERSVKPRITFIDKTNHQYCRPSSDLTLWNRCYFQVRKKHVNPDTVIKELLIAFSNSKRLYLRLGLARPWKKDNQCWMQVTGVYTFPDYLQGKTFLDVLS